MIDDRQKTDFKLPQGKGMYAKLLFMYLKLSMGCQIANVTMYVCMSVYVAQTRPQSCSLIDIAGWNAFRRFLAEKLRIFHVTTNFKFILFTFKLGKIWAKKKFLGSFYVNVLYRFCPCLGFVLSRFCPVLVLSCPGFVLSKFCPVQILSGFIKERIRIHSS